MSGVNEWVDLMPDTVQISTGTSMSAYGVPTYSVAASTYPARYVEQAMQTIDLNGQQVGAVGVVWVATTRALDHDIKLTLPDGRTPPIVRIERYPDENGAHHNKIYLGA